MTHETGDLPADLEAVFASGTVRDEAGTPQVLSSNVGRDEALMLYRVVRALKPAVSVEIGCAHGVSTTAILKALADNSTGTHHVVDPHQRRYGNCGRTLARTCAVDDRLVFHESFAEDVVPALPELGFAFIDSSHLFDLTLAEFVLIDKKLSRGGVIGFHDLWMPSLKKALRYILANRAYEIYRLADERTPPLSAATAMKAAVASALGRAPRRIRGLIASEAFRPWSTLAVGNLVFIQKLENDERDWTFHREF